MPDLSSKLRGDHGQLPELLDSLGLPAVGCGRHGQASWANAHARQLFDVPGRPRSADLMRGWGVWRDADGEPLTDEQMPLARVLAGESVQGMEVVIKPPGAAARFFLASGRSLGDSDPGGGEALVVFNEVTARRRMDQISACQRRVGELLSARDPVEQILPEVLDTIGTALDWAAGEFWVVDFVGKVLRRQVLWDPRGQLPAGSNEQLRRGEGLPGQAWQRISPVWAHDLRTHAGSSTQTVDWAGLQAGLAVPVPSGSIVIAIIVLYSASPEDSADTRAALLPALAGMIGQMLERRRAERLDTELDQSRVEFINLIGHEVRTPLTAIESCTDLLAQDPRLADDQDELLTVMQRNTKNMHSMIDKLLDMAALRAGDTTVARLPVNLTAICRDTARSAQAAGLSVDLNTPADDVILDGDAARLRQVIDELVHTTADTGGVGLNLRTDSLSTVLTVTAERATGAAHAPGPGVPGTALGFTLIRAIVEAHDGDVTLNDNTDPVTTYTIRLPTHRPASVRP
ncbi:hypothetical protein GCM10010124_32610 [Pilimelia terevasa]|uniref:histidine kinase n=1 Tax=Pilimelia terevasa TaxID=53372 RepID=A0A8J3BPJ9_9ACTN|nr:histidine kinase dimerization/phospho-acceptor domain-containing protein [Pilimelia terevasa]GGK37341.1 hypothetical protein GCM10010124_32610 [Pilimelia terevasa]